MYPIFFRRRKQRAARLQDSQRQELIDRAEPEEEGGHGGGHDELPMGEVMMYQVFIDWLALVSYLELCQVYEIDSKSKGNL